MIPEWAEGLLLPISDVSLVFETCFNLNSEIELEIMRHFLLVGRISEKLAEANVRGW